MRRYTVCHRVSTVVCHVLNEEMLDVIKLGSACMADAKLFRCPSWIGNDTEASGPMLFTAATMDSTDHRSARYSISVSCAKCRNVSLVVVGSAKKRSAPTCRYIAVRSSTWICSWLKSPALQIISPGSRLAKIAGSKKMTNLSLPPSRTGIVLPMAITSRRLAEYSILTPRF